jgi:hypothetical protein
LGDEAGVAELLHHLVQGAPVVLDVAVLAVLLAPSPQLVGVHGFGERCPDDLLQPEDPVLVDPVGSPGDAVDDLLQGAGAGGAGQVGAVEGPSRP